MHNPIAACSKNSTEDTPEPVSDPTLTLSLNPDNINLGDSTIVTCVAVNAIRTSNNIGAPTSTEWTFPFTPTETFTVKVTAFAETGKIAKAEKTVTVILLPTKTDTLCDAGRYFQQNGLYIFTGGSWASYSLSNREKTDKWFFLPDGTFERFRESGTTP